MALNYEIELVSPQTPLTTGGGEAIVAQEQIRSMNWAVLAAKGEIIPRTPATSGAYLRKATMTMVYGDKVELIGRVFNPMPYALPLENGAFWNGPYPPIGPLRLWAERKFGVDEGEARSIAFLVSRKLKAHGMAPRRFFFAGYEAAKPQIEAEWARANARIAKRLVTPV
jgi:hypothetical protein